MGPLVVRPTTARKINQQGGDSIAQPRQFHSEYCYTMPNKIIGIITGIHCAAFWGGVVYTFSKICSEDKKNLVVQGYRLKKGQMCLDRQMDSDREDIFLRTKIRFVLFWTGTSHIRNFCHSHRTCMGKNLVGGEVKVKYLSNSYTGR